MIWLALGVAVIFVVVDDRAGADERSSAKRAQQPIFRWPRFWLHRTMGCRGECGTAHDNGYRERLCNAC